ncbi:MAG: alpha-aminoadipate/glutamate carrier protein LysW [Thermococcaceae archaeon]|uniref:lysine biosynthesis protein LysW n=1 Tax=Thermococcus sp. 2319x1 TaxID=1674923 RepID=UPI00073ABF0F|nr:lysine biosynthesis protein LysW [Thermococcus sp. 2319x1]ALV62703.1 Lysine biosynthesis protein LysW [Thermococcus sp. 2319x1]MDI3475906.1 alpha-aminoadipate/glutamate carrier protein LysW [Thermococcaceae archaeon]MDK2914139.1 alpha-aminoadipate/glutamate carrier protein LysW [Thermococcaceae archaeon]
MVECPVCGSEIEVGEVELHQIVECPVCGAELEVVSLEPLTLEELPEVEEDWGE